MDSKAVVQSVMDAVQAGNYAQAKSFLSDDFRFSGPVPEPMNADGWMGILSTLKNASPNIQYHFQVESMDGDTANIGSKLEGTQSAPLDLTAMHMGVIPATNKSWSAALEHGKATVNKGGKVTSWAVEPTEGAGLMAILGQLGVKPPSM
jgi:hypothetical protein